MSELPTADPSQYEDLPDLQYGRSSILHHCIPAADDDVPAVYSISAVPAVHGAAPVSIPPGTGSSWAIRSLCHRCSPTDIFGRLYSILLTGRVPATTSTATDAPADERGRFLQTSPPTCPAFRDRRKRRGTRWFFVPVRDRRCGRIYGGDTSRKTSMGSFAANGRRGYGWTCW